jgi:hypothetical protein
VTNGERMDGIIDAYGSELLRLSSAYATDSESQQICLMTFRACSLDMAAMLTGSSRLIRLD